MENLRQPVEILFDTDQEQQWPINYFDSIIQRIESLFDVFSISNGGKN